MKHLVQPSIIETQDKHKRILSQIAKRNKNINTNAFPGSVNITVDSGACDSIAPPSAFKSTPIEKHSEVGQKYGACGGETVTNIGVKNVTLKTHNKNIKIPFQIGDTITRCLLAVSTLASIHAGLWFGPAPDFDSYIAWDGKPHSANKTDLHLVNGTYQISLNEISGHLSAAELGANDVPGEGGAKVEEDVTFDDEALQDRDLEETGINRPSIENIHQKIQMSESSRAL